MDLYSKYLSVVSKAEENSYFAKCGFVACNNTDDVNGNTMLIGINPSVPFNNQYVPTPSYMHPFTSGSNAYFSKLCKYIPEGERESVGYLDLLPFYEQSQDTLLSNIRGHEAFIAPVIAVTQEEIENINPSLLILANKAVVPYFGALSECVWMGYNFVQVAEEDLPQSIRERNFDVRIIKGFRTDPKAQNEIIYRPADGICKLKGTVVLFYRHSRGLSSEEALSEQDYRELSQFAKEVKSISKYL